MYFFGGWWNGWVVRFNYCCFCRWYTGMKGSCPCVFQRISTTAAWWWKGSIAIHRHPVTSRTLIIPLISTYLYIHMSSLLTSFARISSWLARISKISFPSNRIGASRAYVFHIATLFLIFSPNYDMKSKVSMHIHTKWMSIRSNCITMVISAWFEWRVVLFKRIILRLRLLLAARAIVFAMSRSTLVVFNAWMSSIDTCVRCIDVCLHIHVYASYPNVP